MWQNYKEIFLENMKEREINSRITTQYTKDQLQLVAMHIGKATQGKKVLHLVSNIVTPQVLHTNSDMIFTSLHLTTRKYHSR